MCKNMACVADSSQCHIDLSSLPVLQLEVSVNPYEQADFNFIYDNLIPISGLTLPRGAIPIDISAQLYITYDIFKKVRINPVPTQRGY